MLKRIALACLFASCVLACSKGDGAEGAGSSASGAPRRGSTAAIPTIERAVRVWRQERPTVDLVAAELEGTVMAKTTAQAIMHYDGYRVILTTPGELVTRIELQFDDAKPSVGQLTDLYGKPEETKNGVLFKHERETTRQTILLFANTVTVPAEETTLIRKLLIEGERFR